MKGWYRAAVDRAPPPAWVTLYCIMAERVDLYRYVPPPGGDISISAEPFLVEYSVPTEDDIYWAVKQLRNHRSMGGIRDEGWIHQGVDSVGEE